MEVSPLRALTHTLRPMLDFPVTSRNGSKPVEGIDTSSSPSITTLFISVEMEVSPLRALTRLWLKYVVV